MAKGTHDHAEDPRNAEIRININGKLVPREAATVLVGDVTLRVEDLGAFKSPSLRNVEVTAPYSHDGRFATLEEVVDHYDKHFGLELTGDEKRNLIEYLKSI